MGAALGTCCDSNGDSKPQQGHGHGHGGGHVSDDHADHHGHGCARLLLPPPPPLLLLVTTYADPG
jgi:hypothetical protein